jgi:signal transduction histidine kinase
MSLRLRFLLCLLALAGIMTVPAVFAAGRASGLRDLVLELHGQAAQSVLAFGQLQEALGQVDLYQRAYVVTGDPDLAGRLRGAVIEVEAQVDVLRSAGQGDHLDEVQLQVAALKMAAARLEALVHAGLLEEATTYLNAEAKPLVEEARAGVPALAAAIDAEAGQRVHTAERSAAATATATTMALLVAIGLAFGLAVAAANVLTRPVDRLRRAMTRVAQGTFDAPEDLPYERSDEMGELSRAFRTMTLRLAELDRLKAEFVGSTSHDLKTPIGIINGYAELIEEELGSSLQQRHRQLLEALTEQTRTLQHRVDQLLDISRMEAGRRRLGLEEIDVRHFAEEVRRAFEPTARRGGIRFDLDMKDGAAPVLIADPDVLRTDVLGNLIGNALRCTPVGGTVRLAVREHGDAIHLEVADTGPGMPPEQLRRVFDKYHQGSPGAGGLGLPIARAAVEAHGGRVEVQSWVGRGSRFRVILPQHAVPREPVQHAGAAPAVAGTSA